MNITEVRKLLNNSLEEFKNQNVRVSVGITDLYRAAKLLKKTEDIEWCEIRLGGNEKSRDLEFILNDAFADEKNINYEALISKIEKKGINFKMFIETGEFRYILRKASGGAKSTQYIEEIYDYFNRRKINNNGEEYIVELMEHIALIRAVGISRATKLYDTVDAADIETTFNILKLHVDNQLLNLDPELAEKFMLAFRNASSKNSENLSNALLSGRRLMKKIS